MRTIDTSERLAETLGVSAAHLIEVRGWLLGHPQTRAQDRLVAEAITRLVEVADGDASWPDEPWDSIDGLDWSAQQLGCSGELRRWLLPRRCETRGCHAQSTGYDEAADQHQCPAHGGPQGPGEWHQEEE